MIMMIYGCDSHVQIDQIVTFHAQFMLLIPKQFSGLSQLSFFCWHLIQLLWHKISNMKYICFKKWPISLSSSQLIQHIHQVHLIPNIKHLLKLKQ